MTDNLDRIFVEICFNSKNYDGNDLIRKLESAVSGIGDYATISKDRPPPIFSDQEIEDRFLNLYKTAERYKKGIEGRLGVKLVIDPRLVYLVTISAFDDIERYKAYHLEKPYKDRSDAIKRSAFLTKWIVKISPFQTYYQDGEDPRDIRAALANSLFAIAVSTVNIAIDAKRDFKISSVCAHELCYDLLYRRIDEDALLSLFQKILHLLKDQPIIDIK